MPKIAYRDWKPTADTLQLLDKANEIIADYAAQGYDLTLRQLYYQLVSRDIIPNRQREYNRLGEIVANGRMAGLIDWDAIVDRGRELDKNSHWNSPREILDTAANAFAFDKWANQPKRVLVMVEKDALSGVLEPVCRRLDVPFSANKGYASASHLWRIAQQLSTWAQDHNQFPVILYFGDHDPSGLDMDRDVFERLQELGDLQGKEWSEEIDPVGDGDGIALERLALTKKQIEKYNPPPNPAKQTDSRAEQYIAQFGYESWELDALEPRVLANLVERNILKHRDESAWNEMLDREEAVKEQLRQFAEQVDE